MSKKIVSAHQPNFLPYIGFFDKMQKSDILVIRDETLFTKSDFHHRNKIRMNSHDNENQPKSKWLTVPVKAKSDYIKNILIKRDVELKNMSWNKRILQDIKSAYIGAEYFHEYFQDFESIFDNQDEKLISLNMKLINFLVESFSIDAEIIMASELGLKPSNYLKSDPSDDLVNICKAVGADIYLSGDGAKNYLNADIFDKAEIPLEFQGFEHPVYNQKYNGFLPNMSSIDALFCLGRFPKSENGKIELEMRN